jgi:hypothetical protein
MGILLLTLKVIIVIFFLLMFLRSNKIVWGIGLLTVTSAILLDAFLGTFGREEMLTELGFFYYVIIGSLFSGATFWLWGLFRPLTTFVATTDNDAEVKTEPGQTRLFEGTPPSEPLQTTTGRQDLSDKIRYRLGPDDILDLIFDMTWAENEVIAFDRDTDQLIQRIIRRADQRDQTDKLAFVVERILAPISDITLPRLDKLSANTPRPTLRHYLLATYTLGDLRDLTDKLEVDWELLAGDSKKGKIRALLLYFIRRNRLEELIKVMKAI